MEGPSLVILKEELKPFLKQKVLKVTGNTQEPKSKLKGTQLHRIETWGKVLFLFFKNKDENPIITKTHFMMFGSYRINDPKPDRSPRLELKFKNGTVYFYACSIKFYADEYYKSVDRKVDVLSAHWDPRHVLKLIKNSEASPYLCDLFLDQKLFAGSGNIVKNEILFNLRVHPLTELSQVPVKQWPILIKAVRMYCEDFYEWKKKYELRKHWQVYKKRNCLLCENKITREKLGKLERSTFYCKIHQEKLPGTTPVKLHKVLPAKIKTKVKEKRLDH